MTSTALVLEQNVLSHAYRGHRVCASNNDPDLYAKKLIVVLTNSFSDGIHQRGIHQRGIHCTFGQIEAKFQTEFVFQLGAPSIIIPLSRPAGLSKWVTRVLQLSIEGHEDAALKEISLAIMRIKAKEEFSKLSGDLVSFDLKTLPDIVLVALLRNTFSIRSQISCWNSLIAQTEQLLQEREQDSRSLLRGLKSYS
jgi:hypothetical protein